MRVSHGFTAAVVLGAASTVLGASPSRATPIAYTEQVTATGSLDGVAFTDANVVLTLRADTAGVTGGPTLFSVIGPATVSIAGGTPLAFTDTIEAVSEQLTPTAGFSDVTQALDILNTNSAAFATYDLKTAIGPVTSSSGFSQRVVLPTTGGDFVIAESTAPFIFTATAAVPEPPAVALLGAGLIMLGLAARRHGAV